MGGILLLDTMATRYHLLPSDIIARASSLDLFVLENSISYYRRQKEGPKATTLPTLTQDEMLAMVAAAKRKV